jgi:hypothetical protein
VLPPSAAGDAAAVAADVAPDPGAALEVGTS